MSHPPGYPLYVAAAWILRPLFVDANATYVALSMVASACSAVLLLGLAWRLTTQRAAVVAVVLFVTSPNAWGHALVAYPYAFVSLFSTAVTRTSIETRWGRRDLSLTGALLLGVGSGFRPDLLFLMGPVWLFGVWHRGLRKIALGLLVHGRGRDSMVRSDARPLRWLGRLPGCQRDLVLRVRARLSILFVWSVPAIVFYSVVHIGNLGYLLSVLPAMCIRGAASIEAAASDIAGVLANRVAARWIVVGLAGLTVTASSIMFLGVAGPVTLHEIRDVDHELAGGLQLMRPYPVASTLVLAFDRYRQYDYYLPDYRHADHVVAAVELPQNHLGRATFQVPGGIRTIVLPDLYSNTSEIPDGVERVTGSDGAVIFVAHVRTGEKLRVGPEYARIIPG